MQLTSSPTSPANQKPKPNIGLFLFYVFASAALVIFIAYPKYSDWHTSTTRIASDKQSLAQAQTQAAQVKTEIASLDSADLAKVSSAVPATANLPDLYAQIESLANAATAHIVSMQGIIDSSSPVNAAINGSTNALATTDTGSAMSSNAIAPSGAIKTPTVPSSLGTISLNIDIVGPYSATQQFLSSLYTSLHIITVQQVIMSSKQSTGGAITTGTTTPTPDQSVDLQAQLQTYYSK